MRRSLPFVIAALVLVAGCATAPPEERAQACAATDWQRYGENDGRLGVPTADRAAQFEDCQALGHPPDMAAYQSGRAAGLAVYCTAENGYDIGYGGRRYEAVCPPALEPDFVQGYERGRKERPVVVSPSIGIGVGSRSGVRSRIGIGIGLFGGRWYDDDPYGHWRW